MKNLARLSTLLAVTAITGHGAFWYTTSSKIENKIVAWLESPQENNGTTVNYSIQKFGYPLSIGFKIPTYNITTKGSDELGLADTEIKVAGDFRVSASILSPKKYVATLEDTAIDFINPNNEQVQQAKIIVGNATSTGSIYKKQPDSTQINNLSVVQLSDKQSQTIATMQSLSSTASEVEVSPNSFNRSWNVDMTNITLNNPENPSKNLNIESFNTTAHTFNWPNDADLTKAIEKAQSKSETEDKVSTAEIKKELTVFIGEMAQQGSQFSLEKLTIKGDKVTLNMDANITVQENTQPDGKINVHLDGLQNIAALTGNNTFAQNPLLSQFMTDEDTLKLNLTTENGILMLGGRMLAPVPPLNALIQGVPEYMK